MCQYGNATCGSFEALTQQGYLITDIANTGYVNASYTVTVRSAYCHLLLGVSCCAFHVCTMASHDWRLTYSVLTQQDTRNVSCTFRTPLYSMCCYHLKQKLSLLTWQKPLHLFCFGSKFKLHTPPLPPSPPSNLQSDHKTKASWCRCPTAQLVLLILWLRSVTLPVSQYPDSRLSSPQPPTWPPTAAALCASSTPWSVPGIHIVLLGLLLVRNLLSSS